MRRGAFWRIFWCLWERLILKVTMVWSLKIDNCSVQFPKMRYEYPFAIRYPLNNSRVPLNIKKTVYLSLCPAAWFLYISHLCNEPLYPEMLHNAWCHWNWATKLTKYLKYRKHWKIMTILWSTDNNPYENLHWFGPVFLLNQLLLHFNA